jgi:tetratricopeptide (TPR) repeat protein
MVIRRTPAVLVLAVLAALAAGPAHAVLSGGSKSATPAAPAQAQTPRQQAERLYAEGYEEVEKGRQELASGKTKNAEKRFKKALEKGESAVALDSTYVEALNLVGYSARKLGDYDRALTAYDRALKIKPDYAAAREYLGEAYVELGRLEQAKEQLAELEKLGATEEARTLKGSIDAYEHAKAGSPPAH